MIYTDLQFPILPDRAYCYTNFVSTIDGKVWVKKDGKAYWPLGSELDYQTLIELRTHADCLIHGRVTAEGFKTFESLNKPKFKSARKELGKSELLPYIIVTTHPQEFIQKLPKTSLAIIIATTDEVIISKINNVTVLRCGKEKVDSLQLLQKLKQLGFQTALLEGGPHLMGSFLEHNLLDEIFLTIAPKIWGNNESHNALTMIEGYLSPPNLVNNYSLVSAKPVENEIFLRFRRI